MTIPPIVARLTLSAAMAGLMLGSCQALARVVVLTLGPGPLATTLAVAALPLACVAALVWAFTPLHDEPSRGCEARDTTNS